MKRLSRNDIEAIAEKYVKAYLELPENKSVQVYRIEPEIMLEKVLGLNVEYMHLSLSDVSDVSGVFSTRLQ